MYNNCINVVIIFIITTHQFSSASTPQDPTITRLYNYLMADYRKMRPRYNTSEPVKLDVAVSLSSILDLDGRKGSLTTALVLYHFWTDEFLVWDPALFNGTDLITLPATDVWLPDVGIFNSFSKTSGDAFDSTKDYPVHVRSTGEALWVYSALVESTCDVNMALFPFDTQKCLIFYATLSSNRHEIEMHTLHHYLSSPILHPNGQFIIAYNAVDAVVVNVEDYYEITTLEIKINLQRRPMFYILNIVFPVIALSLIGLLAFCLPGSSGDRVPLQVTMLLSFGVFQLMLNEHIPITSLNMPILSIIIISLLGLSACSLMANIAVINMYHMPATREMSPFTRWVIFGLLGKLVHCKCPAGPKVQTDVGTVAEAWTEHEKQDPDQVEKFESNDLQVKSEEDHKSRLGTDTVKCNMDETVLRREILKSRQDPTRKEHEKGSELAANQWQQAADIIDRVFLILFLITFVVVSTLVFTIGYM